MARKVRLQRPVHGSAARRFSARRSQLGDDRKWSREDRHARLELQLLRPGRLEGQPKAHRELRDAVRIQSPLDRGAAWQTAELLSGALSRTGYRFRSGDRWPDTRSASL